ncbi:DUF6074 family protein [Bradyrhizobium sp. RT5a]|uniref:DUF6074 family protein n=1 Tax=Bradyrhizobium sp. RT5a TaxID=3156380 RepID=UPI00339B4329
MTEKATVVRAVRDTRHEVAPDASASLEETRLHVRIAEPKAKVMLLPGRFRDAAYVQRHVSYVVAMDAERGEQHVRRNLNVIRRTLDEMGVDPVVADREVRSIEARVRAELWRQILTPDGQP